MNVDNCLWIVSVSNLIKNRYVYINSDVADFIACQFALESAYGTSRLARESFNISGMKVPHVRLSTSVADDNGFAVYSSFNSCICDFFYWLQYNGFNQSHLKCDLSVYLAKFSKLNYCPDHDYIKNINSIYQLFKLTKDGKK